MCSFKSQQEHKLYCDSKKSSKGTTNAHVLFSIGPITPALLNRASFAEVIVNVVI